MSSLSGLKVAVAGAGAFGLGVALLCLEAGASVDVWDPNDPLDSASGVAAGMIAPAAEIVFDRLDADHAALLTSARDRWRAFADLVPGLDLDRSGTVLRFADEEACDAARVRLAASDAGLEPCAPLRLFAPGDWRVDPRTALPALRQAIAAKGGRIVPRRLNPAEGGGWDALVLASGFSAVAEQATAPELRVLTPIKGQIVRFSGGPAAGPALRSAEVYLVPHAAGAVAGATMEHGRQDLTLDEGALSLIRSRAIALEPTLEDLCFSGAAGVRAGVPDRLPLVGRSSRPGLWLAVGARRNGWLLAPLVGEILVSYLSGGDGGGFGPIVAPRRWFAA